MTAAWVRALVLLPTAGLYAQVIRGTVRDQASKFPLPGVTVSILDTEDSTVKVTQTTDSGRFVLTLSGAGTYAINLRRLGYTELTTTASALGPGDTVSISFEMGMAPVTLDTVTTKSHADSSYFTKVTPGHIIVAEHYKLNRGLIVSGYEINKSGLAMTEYLGKLAGVRLSSINPVGTPVIPSDNGQFLVSNQQEQCLYGRIDHAPILFLLIQDWAANIDEILRPKDIMAVEFYRTTEEVPPEWLADATMTEIVSRSYSLTYTYTGKDRYLIGTNLPLSDVLQLQDTVYQAPGDAHTISPDTVPTPGFGAANGATRKQPIEEPGAHAGYGAARVKPDALTLMPMCGFMQVWTKASW